MTEKEKDQTHNRRVAAQLGQLLKDMDLEKRVYREVVEVGKQVAADNDGLAATDLAQLRDLAEISQRIADGNGIAKRVKESDPDQWAKILTKVQGDTALRRGLLRDLKATKMSRTAGSGNSNSKKKPDGGGDWEGIL